MEGIVGTFLEEIVKGENEEKMNAFTELVGEKC
jgi:hypothetical protein